MKTIKITKHQLDIQKERVMSRFNFDAVHNAMVAMNWRWKFSGRDEIPSVEWIKETVARYIDRLIDNQECSTGGFTYRLLNGEYGPYVQVEFTLCEADGEFADY